MAYRSRRSRWSARSQRCERLGLSTVEMAMAIDPLAPVKFGIGLGAGVVRLELRVIERILGLSRPEREPVVVVVEHEPAVAPEPAPEPQVAAAEPPPIPEP